MGGRIEAVLLLGAGGTLGRRLARLLAAELPGVRLVPASRRGPAALGPAARACDVRDAHAIARALDGIGLVVNAVGPYRYDPRPLVESCVAAGAHCVDLAEDAGFIAAVRAAAERAGAAAAGVAFVPGCSTVPGLVELFAQGFARISGLAAVDAWLSLGTQNPASAALIDALLRPMGRDAPGGGRWFSEVVWRRIDGRALSFGRFPSGFPGERVRIGARDVPIRFHAGFDLPILVRGLRLAAPQLARLSDERIAQLARAGARAARLARLAGSPRGVLRVEAKDAGGVTQEQVEVVAVRDGLDVPVAPAVWAARALASAPRQAGVLRLFDLVTRGDALAGLAALRCAVGESVDAEP